MSKQVRNIIPSEDSILYIDIGNTSIKAAYKEGVQWKYPDAGRTATANDLVKWANSHQKKFDLTVVCSVVRETTEALKEGLDSQLLRVFTADDIPEELLNYQTPETLGIDRFFACYGALSHTPGAVVVIDAGTACTVDYMSADAVFMGGVIMPGIGMMEDALRTKTPKLPVVDRSLPETWPGRSSRSSLQWGVTGTFKNSIETFLGRYEEEFGDFTLHITGGDADWLSRIIERESRVRGILVFEGMYHFLEDYL